MTRRTRSVSSEDREESSPEGTDVKVKGVRCHE